MHNPLTYDEEAGSSYGKQGRSLEPSFEFAERTIRQASSMQHPGRWPALDPLPCLTAPECPLVQHCLLHTRSRGGTVGAWRACSMGVVVRMAAMQPKQRLWPILHPCLLQGFIRKVFGILALQLAVTVGIGEQPGAISTWEVSRP